MKLGSQIALVTALAAATLGVLGWSDGDFMSLWLTPDQQGRRAFEGFEFQQAVELFEDPMWKATSLYSSGQYPEAAGAFGRIPDAVGFYDRGNALLKGFEYDLAIASYELAVAEAPEWTEALENLALARYVLEYIEGVREQSDTGDETELGADEVTFDNTRERGKEILITEQSTIEMESAEKWMRSVDTEMRDFLRVRFAMEKVMAEAATGTGVGSADSPPAEDVP